MSKRKTTRKRKNASAIVRRRRMKKFGLAGFKAPTKNSIMDSLMGTGIIAISVLAGRELSRKVFKGDEKEGFSQYIGAAVKIGGGVILATQDNKFLKYIGIGLAAEGAIDAAGIAMGKDIIGEGILNGLEGYFDTEQISGAKVYDELPPLPESSEDEDYSDNSDEYGSESESGDSVS